MLGFGNGQDASPAAPDTGSMWGDLFGMGSLIKVISDPALMAHAHQMMGAVIEGANANRRIEAKLDRLLKALGNDIADIDARFPNQFQPSALLEQRNADGARGHPPATSLADDGSGGAAHRFAPAGGDPRGGGSGLVGN
jgi:hypothetical protein